MKTEGELKKRGWKDLTIFMKCKEASGKMAFSPEGEFHGSKGRQKGNRAKSIRECKKKRAKQMKAAWRKAWDERGKTSRGISGRGGASCSIAEQCVSK